MVTKMAAIIYHLIFFLHIHCTTHFRHGNKIAYLLYIVTLLHEQDSIMVTKWQHLKNIGTL